MPSTTSLPSATQTTVTSSYNSFSQPQSQMQPQSQSNSQTYSHPDIPPFPDPSTFTILPDIYLLISRLKILQSQLQSSLQQTQTQQDATQQSQSTGANATTNTNTNNTTTINTLSGATAPTGSTTGTSIPNHLSIPESQQIETKELPALVQPIKQKIAKARAAVSSLPNVEMSVAQQEREIEVLEVRIRGLRKRLVEFGEVAAKNMDGKRTKGGGVVKEEEMGDEEGEAGTGKDESDVVMQGVES